MRQMLDTRSSAASATQLSRLCKPSSEAVQKNCWPSRWGSVPESGAYRPVLMICFCQNSFHQKENLWIHQEKFGNPQDSIGGTVCRQKKAEKRHFPSNWPKRGLASFLNTEQLHPLWVKLYQLDREDQALLVGLPVGEGDALWAELCEGPFGQWSQSSSCRKSWKFIWVEGLISFAGSTGRRNQFAKSSPFNYSCSSAPIFPKGSIVTGPRKGAPLFTPFTQASLCSWRAHYGGGEP